MESAAMETTVIVQISAPASATYGIVRPTVLEVCAERGFLVVSHHDGRSSATQ
jgi:hypothetical protein